MSKILLDSTIVSSSNQVSTDLGEEAIILGLQSEEYFVLKDVGTRIWDMIQEPVTVKEVLGVLLKEYEVEPDRCEHDLLALLQQMADEGLINIKDAETT